MTKIILLVVVLGMLFWQLSKMEASYWNQVQIINSKYFILATVLIVFNWYFEWKKWAITLHAIKTDETKKTDVLSFFAGIVTGLVTPNMLGNFIGRMYYFKRRFRPSIILLTLLANSAQFFASILFGFISILVLDRIPVQSDLLPTLKWALGIFICFLFLAYFFFERINWKLLLKRKIYSKMIAVVRDNRFFRTKVLSYSLLRHAVFSFQFFLLLNAFQPAWNMEALLWIWQIFLWTTIIPSLWFGKLVIRESIAIWVLGAIGYNELAVLASSIILWLMNLALPAVVGLVVCTKKSVPND